MGKSDHRNTCIFCENIDTEITRNPKLIKYIQNFNHFIRNFRKFPGPIDDIIMVFEIKILIFGEKIVDKVDVNVENINRRFYFQNCFQFFRSFTGIIDAVYGCLLLPKLRAFRRVGFKFRNFHQKNRGSLHLMT
jgi:hypothetical protein